VKAAVILAFFCAGGLCGAAQLAVERLALHQFEDGPILDATYEFLPGETANFSCRLAGYQVEEAEKDHRKVKLSWRMEARDSAGVPLVEPAEGRIDADLFPEDTNWLPKFLKTFVVPPFALSGEYRISVRVHDEIANTEVSAELPFHVHGHPLEPSVRLAVRNFAFLVKEDDALGMRQPVYRPGDMAWARMDVTGYKFGERNRYSIAFGMRLEDSEGKALFSLPEAGGETHESFYPQSYSPATLNLSLGKDTPAGTYTLVVTVNDAIGNQNLEVRESFRVQ
jgi:hypothetical protein